MNKNTYFCAVVLSVVFLLVGFLPQTVRAATLSISSLDPSSVKAGEQVTIHGSGFNSASYVSFVGQNLTVPATSYTNSALTFMTPSWLSPGMYPVRIIEKAGDAESNTAELVIESSYVPNIITLTSVSPSSAHRGERVTISGSGFNSASYVSFVGQNLSAPATSYTDNSLTFTVPSGASFGSHSIRVFEKAGDAESNSLPFSVIYDEPVSESIVITSLEPSSAKTGTSVIIHGSGFNSASYVWFEGQNLTILPTAYTGSTLTFSVPSSLSPGTYRLRVSEKAGSATSNRASFRVVQSLPAADPISITSLSPSTVVPGGTVTIYGSGFSSASYVDVVGQNISIKNASYSNTRMTFVLPTWFAPGTYSVRVFEKAGSSFSNTKSLTVAQAAGEGRDKQTPVESPDAINVTGDPGTTPEPSGVNEGVVVTPVAASEKAVTTFSLDTDVAVELVNEEKPVYEVVGIRGVRVLGIFKSTMRVVARIDAETGEIESVSQPWWSVFAF